ncbi:MAG TPA: hypothetical protein VN158_06700, partial [Caulobacter sp.]|nr:hypothetical protein [Caulobacter sp.]
MPARSVLNGPDQLAIEAEAVRLFTHPTVQAAVQAQRAAFEAHPLARTLAGRANLPLNLEEMAFSAVVSVVAMDVGRSTPFWTLNLPHERDGLRIPGTRHGVDNPDNVYRVIAVDDVSRFRVDGQVNDRQGADVSFTLFDAYPGSGVDSQSQGVLVLDQLDTDADGRFSFTVGPDAAGDRANHLQTRPGAARLIFVRDSLQDWAVETPVSLTVTRTAGPEVAARTEDQLVAEAVEAVGASIDYWLRLMLQWFAAPFNDIAKGRAKNFSYTQQATSEARFRLASDEALVVTIDPCGARYLGVQLADPWGASIDYGAHTSSLNQHQAHRSADGTITYVVSLSDPGVHNWLDPAGLEQGTMLHRWQGLPDGGFDA